MDFSFLDVDDLEITLAEAAWYWCDVSPKSDAKQVAPEISDMVDKRRRILNAAVKSGALSVRENASRSGGRGTVTLKELRRWFAKRGESPLFLFPESRPDWIGDGGTPWDHASDFSLRDAAEAFAGKGAPETDINQWRSMLIEAARQGQFATRNRRDSWNDPGDTVVFIRLEDPGESARVSRADLRRWAEGRAMKGRENARFLFPLGAGAANAQGWPKHSTPNLDHLKAAITEFWENHDPAAPPKKPEVVAWLKKRGVSERTAGAIDTIIRTSEAAKGGNKKRKGGTLKS